MKFWGIIHSIVLKCEKVISTHEVKINVVSVIG